MNNINCKTKYPIVMVHGLGLPDLGGDHPYWGRLPDTLRADGATVFFGGQDAWGSIETGAAQLWRAVQHALRETGAARVNLLAHSKGGLEARHMISALGHGRRVASLTMLGTPNRGSDVAQTLLRAKTGIALWAQKNDAYWRAHGDQNPETLRAGMQLTPAYLEEFNRENPNARCVFYQSVGAYVGRAHADGGMRLTRGLFYPISGENDGLVTPQSAKWGVYRGTLAGVSHRMLADAFSRDVGGFDVRGFYLRLVRELAAHGF